MLKNLNLALKIPQNVERVSAPNFAFWDKTFPTRRRFFFQKIFGSHRFSELPPPALTTPLIKTALYESKYTRSKRTANKFKVSNWRWSKRRSTEMRQCCDDVHRCRRSSLIVGFWHDLSRLYKTADFFISLPTKKQHQTMGGASCLRALAFG